VGQTDSTKSHRALVAHLSRSRAPAMCGVHAALHDVAAAIVGICIVVVVRIVVVIGVVVIIGIEAESEAVMPEVVIMTVESAIMEAMIVESAGEGATVESAEAAVVEAASKPAAMEATAPESAAVEASAATKATMAPAAKSAATKGAATTVTAAATSSATSASRKRHCGRSQANTRNSQRYYCLPQHFHSPSEIFAPNLRRAGGDRFGQLLLASACQPLNSARGPFNKMSESK
jgi:hypothetical protein